MKKVVGYIISIAGIVIMAASFGMVSVIPNEIIGTLPKKIITITGIAMITVGVIIALKFSTPSKSKTPSRVKHSGEDEVPIYEGTGKNRKVVGYRKD